MPAREAKKGHERLYTIQEAAKKIGVSPDTLRRWDKKGTLSPKRTLGGQRRYSTTQIESFLAKNSQETKPSVALRPSESTTQTTHNGYAQFLTIQEAAAVLGISAKTLRRWDAKGVLLPIRTPGGQRRYSNEQLQNVLGKKEEPISKPPQAQSEEQTAAAGTPQTLVDAIEPEPFEPLIPEPLFIERLAMFKHKTLLTKENIAANLNDALEKIPEGVKLFTVLAFFITSLFIGASILVQNTDKLRGTISEPLLTMLGKRPSEEVLARQERTKAVLAAETNRLQLTGTLSFNLPATFNENVTAPNIVYSATAGEGITVAGGQTPTITNADPGSGQNIFGNIKLGSDTASAGSNTDTFEFAAGSNVSLSLDKTNKKLTITSTDTTGSGDITAVSVGNGLSGGGSSGDVTVSLDVTTTSTSTTTTANSGLETASSGLSLLRGCSDSQVLQWDATNVYWKCGSASSSFTLAGDSGTSQTISGSDTMTIAGGTNGIDTVASSTDTITLNFDATEVGTTTWGSGSALAWTFNAGATDPLLTFDSNSLAITSAVVSSTISGAGSDALQLNLTQSDDDDSTDNSAALRLALTSSSADADLLYGIDIGNITEGSATEVAFRIGSGWTNLIEFEGATNNDFETYYQITDPTADNTITIPNASGTICLTSNNCVGSGGGSGVTFTSPSTANAIAKFTTTTGNIADSSITDNGSSIGMTIDIDLTFAAAENLSLTNTTASSDQLNLSISGVTTDGADGIALAFTQADDEDATDTNAGINLAITGNSGDADTLVGLNIANLAGSSAAATSYALQIGSGWDSNLYLNDTTSRVLLANTGTIVIHDGTNTLCTITDNVSVGDLSCTGSITGASSGTNGFWSRSDPTLSPATANDIVSISSNTTSASVLSLTDTGISTGTGTTSVFNLVSNSTQTGDIMNLSASGLTTGSLIVAAGPTSTGVTDHFIKISADVGSAASLVNLNPDFSGAGVTGYGIYNTATDATTATNTDYGYYGSLALTGNAAKTAYGMYQTINSTSTTAETAIYGTDIWVDHNAAVTSGNKSLYGLRAQVTNDGITDASTGTHNIYGGYFSSLGNTGDTQNVYGIYSSATGGDNNYGLTIAAISTAGTANQGINIGNLSGAATSKGIVVGTNSSATTVGLEIGALSGSTANRGISIGTITAAATANNFGVDIGAITPQASATVASINTSGIAAGAGTATYGINIGTNASTATTNYGINIGAISGAGTTNYGLYVGAVTGAGTNYDVYIAGTEGQTALQVNTGDAVIADGSLAITDDDNAASFSVTNNIATTIGAGINTAGVVDISSSTLSTGNLLNLETTTALSTGRVLNATSTSTALTTGNLLRLDWTPGSATTATGDLFVLNIGTNGTTTGNLLNITDAGTSLFSVSETQMTSALPANFTAAGDVSIAYDIVFTNPTASYIKSQAPLQLVSGETFNSSNLTLQVYNTGSVVVSPATGTSTSTNGLLRVDGTSATTSYASAYINTTNTGSSTTAYGIYNNYANAGTTATTDYGMYIAMAQSGALTSGTKNVYGLYSAPTTTGANTSTATVNVYGEYAAPSSTTSTTATVNVYGQYVSNTATVTSTGTVNSYGLYVANGTSNTTGTSTKYGIYVAHPSGADTNTSAILQAPSAFTQAAALIGLSLDYNTNFTGATGVNITGILMKNPPDLTITSATTYTGIELGTTSGAYTTNGADFTYNGLKVTTPNLTQTANVATANGINLANGTLTTGGAQNGINFTMTAVGAGTLNGMLITPPGTTTAGGTINGINIAAIATASNGTDNAITIGATWDKQINGNQFSVDGVGVVTLNLATTSSNGVCHTNAGTGTAEVLLDCTGTITDYAEFYATTGNTEPGDLLVTTANPLELETSNTAYQTNVVGVLSTNPNDPIGQTFTPSQHPQPVGLAGRVPVKVSLENGLIKKGDFITSSSTPGVAMKATKPGMIIGTALEDYDGSVLLSADTLSQEQHRVTDHPDYKVYHSDPTKWPAGVGKISVLVRVSFADPQGILANLAIGPNGTITTTSQQTAVLAAQTSTTSSATLTPTTQTATPSAASNAAGASFDIASDPLFAAMQTEVASLSAKIAILQDSIVASASTSAFLQTATTSALLTPSVDLSTALNEATISGRLTVLGRTTLTDLGVTGDITAGLMTIKGLDGEINTLAGPLKLQSNGINDIELVAGNVKIDTNGNILAKSITVEEVKITAGKTTGSGIITAGTKTVDIDSTYVAANSRIFVTATTQTAAPLAVVAKKPGQKFTVSIPTPTAAPITFDWWIVNEQ